MNVDEYRTMRDIEDDFWWYVGFRKIYASVLDRYCPGAASGRVLDAGCGTGAFMEFLNDRYHPIVLTGLDFSEEALEYCRERGLGDTIRCSVVELPFEGGSFDLVVSLDVLCHRSIPDELVPLAEFRRVLRPGGYALINLPAFQSIYSEHDVAVHTRHRYRKREVADKLAAAGFEPVMVSYANFFLFPAVAAARLRTRASGSKREGEAVSDLKRVPKALNRALACVLGVEARIVPLAPLPCGSSVTALARSK